MARVHVHFDPAGAALAVDGRPLETVEEKATPPVLAAGLRPAGSGESPPSNDFVVMVDPGAHVFVFSQKGFANAVVPRTFRPGEQTSLDLHLERLPAHIHIASNRPRAIVSMNGSDVGALPLDLERPSGSYHLVVREPGFVPYETRVTVAAGEETSLFAELSPEKPSILSRWWFWTAAGVVVVGAATTTYFVTRPEPERPSVGGGTLGWAVDVRR